MSQSLDEALRNARATSDGRVYRSVKLPPRAITLAAGVVAELGRPFCSLIVDKDEVSLMIPQEAVAAFETRLRLAEISALEYRLITLDVALAPELVGFIARVAAALAAAGVPVLTIAAHSRDHVFVPAADFDKAMLALKALRKD